MKDEIDEMFYRDYGETDDNGGSVVAVLYVTDGVPVTRIVIGQNVWQDDTGIKIPVELAKKWGLTTD
jgi:hypothetical protein